MAIFIDVLYPGNKERKGRIDQVTADCSSMFANAAKCKSTVESQLAECDKVIQEAYQGLAKTPPPLTKVSVTEDWVIYVPTLLVDTVAGASAVWALRWAWSNYLVCLGKITAQQLAELGMKGAIKIVVPNWLRIGAEGIASIAAAVIVDLLVDSISGAVQRSELQKGIQEITETRVGMKQTEMFNDNLMCTLQSVIMAFNALQGLGLSEETYNTAVQRLLDKYKITKDSITRASAVKELQDLDTHRSSWTKEDGDWATRTASARLIANAQPPALTAQQRAVAAIESLSLPQEQLDTALCRLMS